MDPEHAEVLEDARVAERSGVDRAPSALRRDLDGVGMTIADALRAAGDTTGCMIARLVLAWAIYTPLGYVAVIHLHGVVVVVMCCLIVYLVLIAGTMAFRFRMGRWRTIEMIEPRLVDA